MLVGATLVAQAGPALADSLGEEAAAVFDLNDRYVTGLRQATAFALLPDGRMVITQKGGDVAVRLPAGTVETAGHFDVDASSEKGLLNVLPHPDFASNRLLFFYYSLANSDGGNRDRDRHRVSTVELGANNRLNMGTLRELVTGLQGPANHDGGALAIGPDGKLYIGVGDTGCNSQEFVEPTYDPTNYYATCLTNGNGKILRINLDGTIPSDNPLVDRSVPECGASCGDAPSGTGDAREDIWTWGFRNPWRFWFDPQTGHLWVGDVGERSFEEINVIPQANKGKHYGWPWREGRKGHPRSACNTSTPGAGDCVEPAYACRQAGFADATVADVCKSITGGFIMDSCQWPAPFRGRYFFADNALLPSPLWTLDVTGDRSGVVANTRKEFLEASSVIVHLAPGNDGALYYAVHGDRIGRVTPKSPASCPDAGAGTGGTTGSAGRAGSAGAGGGTAGAGGVGGTGTSGQGGTSSPGGGDDSDDGCGCRVPRGHAARSAFGLTLFGAAFLFGARLLRRRRERMR